RAASHREAPLMTLDPAADITDVYAFVSYDTANLARASADRKVTLILNVIPAQEPSSGPNYFAFDDNVLYELHVDNNKDGDAEDVIYQFRFQTTVDTPLSSSPRWRCRRSPRSRDRTPPAWRSSSATR